MTNPAQTASAALAAELHHGDPLMIDYTPLTAVKGGEMIAYSATVTVVAHNDIAGLEMGAVAFPGGNAVYRVKLGTGESYNMGDAVTVDIATQEAKAAGVAPFGVCVEADVDQAAGDVYVYAVHA